MIAVNDTVVVKKKMLHGNLSDVRLGRAVAVEADRVSVHFPGEHKALDFPVDQVTQAKDTFGPGSNFDNPREMPITKLYR